MMDTTAHFLRVSLIKNHSVRQVFSMYLYTLLEAPLLGPDGRLQILLYLPFNKRLRLSIHDAFETYNPLNH